jgi:hypothetical protein
LPRVSVKTSVMRYPHPRVARYLARPAVRTLAERGALPSAHVNTARGSSSGSLLISSSLMPSFYRTQDTRDLFPTSSPFASLFDPGRHRGAP